MLNNRNYDEQDAQVQDVSVQDFSDIMNQPVGSKHDVQIDGAGRIRVSTQGADGTPEEGTVSLTRRRAWY